MVIDLPALTIPAGTPFFDAQRLIDDLDRLFLYLITFNEILYINLI